MCKLLKCITFTFVFRALCFYFVTHPICPSFLSLPYIDIEWFKTWVFNTLENFCIYWVEWIIFFKAAGITRSTNAQPMIVSKLSNVTWIEELKCPWFLCASADTKIFKRLKCFEKTIKLCFQAEHALYTPGLDENRGSSTTSGYVIGMLQCSVQYSDFDATAVYKIVYLAICRFSNLLQRLTVPRIINQFGR